MSEIAITVKNLGKEYRIGHKESYKTLNETISRKLAGIFRIFSMRAKKGSSELFDNEKFWALKHVTFDIKKGDVVGIIGRNGAGKSTLLKILSRITSPSEGFAEVHGRVGSLLEVGTGFHPELSGRENIYLSGSILGMKRSEIDQKFDDIVKFSEIEKFLDTPVKRYSSGMYVRLAFAVAAHLEPEILIIDEVLAVGDAQFQKKCLGKMEDVAKRGRTVLFVSHNMNAIEQLCTSCILLQNGRIKRYSRDVRNIISTYLFDPDSSTNSSEWVNYNNEFNNPWFQPLQFYIGNSNGDKSAMPVSNIEDIWIYIKGTISEFDPALQIGFAIYDENGVLLYWSCHTDEAENNWIKFTKGENIVKTVIPKRFLNQGIYRIEMIVALYYRQWICEPGTSSPAIILNIQGGLSDSPYWLNSRPGILAPVMTWQKISEGK
jgi:lipopolysaccharide transport system ATP-binding protein